METFIVAVECAIEAQGKFLLIERPKGKHAEGMLSFPGGKLDLSDIKEGCDPLIEGLRREVKEEVGLELDSPIEYITSSCFIDDKLGIHVVDSIYHCKLSRLPDKLTVSAEEVPCYAWLSYEEALSLPNCPEWLVRYLTLIVKRQISQ